MKNILFFLMAIAMPLLALSQERFYNLYEGWRINEVVIKNDLYYTFGSVMHPTTDGNLPQFNIIDESGTLQDAFYYYSDTTDGLTVYRSNSYLMSNNDTVVFVGSYTDYYKAYTLNPIMMKYNLETRNIDTIISYNHCVETSNPQKAILYLIDTIETGFIITGVYAYNNYNSFPMLIFTDRAGDTLAVKKYPFLPADAVKRRVYPYQLLPLPDGGYLLSCQDEIGYESARTRSWFVRLDSAGNELWRRTTAGQDTICFHPFAFVMPDGDYLITWSDPYLYNSVPPHAPSLNPARTLWLADMNDNGTITNKRKITEDIENIGIKKFYINDYYQDSTGDVFLVGEMSGYHGFLLKISKSGIAEWMREYECFPDNDASDKDTRLYSITPTPDGGFIMGGEYYSNAGSMFPSGVQKGLAVKVDECGCLEEDCNLDCYNGYSAQTIKAMQAVVYPNPANDVVTVSLPVKGSTARIELFDATGCQWVDVARECSETTTGSQVKLNVAGLPSGVYLLNVWIEGKLCTGKVVVE